MNKIREFISKNRNEFWFRPALVIVIMLALSFGISVYNGICSGEDKVPEQSVNIVWEIIDGSKVHIMLLGAIALGIAHYDHCRELKLKESRGSEDEKTVKK